jgi:hypothetical protein
MLSNGLYGIGPLIHPIDTIAPMSPPPRGRQSAGPRARWFELGNPGGRAVCIDPAARLPGGGCPIFASVERRPNDPPRMIALSFEGWFLELLWQGGREYWLEADFAAFAARRGARFATVSPRLVVEYPA